MILLSQDSWLSNLVSAGILVVLAALAFFSTRRWGWKAWPIILLSTLLVPVVGYALVVVAFYYIDVLYGLAGGFAVHLGWLALMVLGVVTVGSGLGFVARQRRANGG